MRSRQARAVSARGFALPIQPASASLRSVTRSYDDADECAFAVDAKQRIVYWNRAAEQLFGRSASEALGTTCDRLVAGHGRDGRLCCHAQCPIWRMVQTGRHIQSFDLLTASRDGQPVWVAASTLVARENGHTFLLHVFQDICNRKRLENLLNVLLQALEDYGMLRQPAGSAVPFRSRAAEVSCPTEPKPVLTRREIDILRLVSHGYPTRAIAARLTLSEHTVRNHVRNALARSGLHSRAEAVSFAIRHGLL